MELVVNNIGMGMTVIPLWNINIPKWNCVQIVNGTFDACQTQGVPYNGCQRKGHKVACPGYWEVAMLDKNEILEMLWNLECEMSKRSHGCRENAENAEQRGDDDVANFWYNASDEDWGRAMGILDAIRAIESL